MYKNQIKIQDRFMIFFNHYRKYIYIYIYEGIQSVISNI